MGFILSSASGGWQYSALATCSMCAQSLNVLSNRLTALSVVHPALASVVLEVFVVCLMLRTIADDHASSSSPSRSGPLRSDHHPSDGNEYRRGSTHLRHNHQLHHVFPRAGGVLNWLTEDSKRIDIRTVRPSSQSVLVLPRLAAVVSIVRSTSTVLAGVFVA